jgi:dipeptidyl aminopeptidase/acylaminoacyl peptidase
LVDPASPTQLTLRSARDAGLARTLELAATLYLPPADDGVPGPGLLVGHGAGSRRGRHDGFCREACAQGFVVLALDFRGHGDSAGHGDGPLEQDIFAAVELLSAHPRVDPERVCYRGSSMGGFYGLKAAPQARFAALALLCPASEAVILNALDDKERTEAESGSRSSSEDAPPRWDTAALRSYFQRQDSVRLASQVECPVLLVHARGDDVVPLAHSLRLCRHLRTETTLLALEEGTHTSSQHDLRIHRYTSAWLFERVARKPVSAHTERT